MIICVDFDGTIVDDSHKYDDLAAPLLFLPGAKDALVALKAAGNILILYSGRANPWLMRNPDMDPLVIAGVRKVYSGKTFAGRAEINRARYVQMVTFVKKELPGVFDLIWEHQGKPSADIFIDDRTPYGAPDWRKIKLRFA